MRVLVCGGRYFRDRVRFFDVMDDLHARRRFSAVVHGCASGADHEAEVWGVTRELHVLRFPPEWDMHGKSAGPIRNRQMLEVGRPDLVVAFPGGRGTADMVRRARAAGIEVIEVAERWAEIQRKDAEAIAAYHSSHSGGRQNG